MCICATNNYAMACEMCAATYTPLPLTHTSSTPTPHHMLVRMHVCAAELSPEPTYRNTTAKRIINPWPAYKFVAEDVLLGMTF